MCLTSGPGAHFYRQERKTEEFLVLICFLTPLKILLGVSLRRDRTPFQFRGSVWKKGAQVFQEHQSAISLPSLRY